MEQHLIAEVYRTLVLLGAEADVLGIIGSWQNGAPKADVLHEIRGWNEQMLCSLKARIEHYGMTFPRHGDNQGEHA